MPKRKSGEFDQLEYIKQYNRENIRYRRAQFNMQKPEDVQIMKWIDEQPEGTSAYIRKLIMQDMAERKQN